MPTPPEFPLRILYDGACPICSREVEHYRRRDRAGRLLPVDISAPGFDPAPYGLALPALMAELHAIDRRGTVYRGIVAFAAIWRAFPERRLYRVLAVIVAWPLIDPLARLGYRWFTRLRPRLPGRKNGCEAGNCRIGGGEPPEGGR